MFGEQTAASPVKGIEVATLAARNLYPAGLRTWGMRITVYADPVATNNRTYELVYNRSSTSKANNSNWDDASVNIATVVTSKTRKTEFPIAEHTAATAGSNPIVLAADLANGESVKIHFDWVAKVDGAAEGASGEFSSQWTKEGGVLTKIAEGDIIKHNNTGLPIAVSTSQANSIISIAVTETGSSNISYSGYVRLLFRKAA